MKESLQTLVRWLLMGATSLVKRFMHAYWWILLIFNFVVWISAITYSIYLHLKSFSHFCMVSFVVFSCLILRNANLEPINCMKISSSKTMKMIMTLLNWEIDL